MVDRAGVEAVLKPIKVGPEMAALRRFLPEVVIWEGTIHEGGMDRAPWRCAGSAGAPPSSSRTGAGSPETTSKTRSWRTARSC